MSRKEVAVLGCGPAGLIAAHTAKRLGHDVTIFSRKEKSVFRGAQVLHRQIKGVAEKQPPLRVKYLKLGTQEGYAEKIYGSATAACSWSLYPEGVHDAWLLQPTYEILWRDLQHEIVDMELSRHVVGELRNSFAHVFSTVPLPAIATEFAPEVFRQQPVWIRTDYHWGPTSAFVALIEYNGTNADDWYRQSWIGGWESVEYPGSISRPSGCVRVVKPLSVVGGDTTRAELVPPGVCLVGRYGQWRKGVLVHHAEQQVEESLS